MKLKKITMTALLLALCIVGGSIKIMGSIALDSFPAFLGSIILGPMYGAFLGIAGHLFSALLAGFPQTLPLHFIIASCMALCMYIYGVIRQRWHQGSILSKGVSVLAAYLINVPFNLLILYPLLHDVVFVLFVPLTIATISNLAITEIVYLCLPKKILEIVQ